MPRSRVIKTAKARGYVTYDELNAVCRRGGLLRADRGHHVDAVRHGHQRGRERGPGRGGSRARGAPRIAPRRKSRPRASSPRRALPAVTNDARRADRAHRRPRAHVPARDGLGRAAVARGRDRHRQAHRGRPRGHDRRPVREPADLPGHHHLARRADRTPRSCCATSSISKPPTTAPRPRPRRRRCLPPTPSTAAAAASPAPANSAEARASDGEPRPEGEIDDEDDYENALSLAAMEAELKPKVLETFDNIADTYKKLRKLQDKQVEMQVASEQFNRQQQKAYDKLARRDHRGRQEPVAQQQPHREPGRAALRHQQAPGGAGRPPDAAGRQLRRAAPAFIDEYFGNELDQALARAHGATATRKWGAVHQARARRRSSRSATRSARWPPRPACRSPSSAASSRPCRRASARRARPRRRWSRPTCASSSPSPRSTPTAACSSWT